MQVALPTVALLPSPVLSRNTLAREAPTVSRTSPILTMIGIATLERVVLYDQKRAGERSISTLPTPSMCQDVECQK